MSTNKFDNHARKEISTHETPLDTEALWGKVQADLHPKQKKKFAWVWFSASSFFLAILLAGYFYTNKQTGDLKQASAAGIQKETPSQKSTTVTQNATKTQAIKLPANTPIKKEIIATKKANNINDLAEKKKTANTVKSNDQQENTTTINQSITVQNSVKAKTNLVTPQKDIIENEPINTLINITTEQKTNNALPSPMPQEEVEEIEELEKENLPSLEKADKTKENKVEKDKIIAISKENIEAKGDEIIASTNEDENKEPMEELKDEEENNEEIKLKKKYRLGIGFRTGISKSTTTLSAIGGTNKELAALRNQSETNLETIDLGLEVLWKHKSGFYAATGIDYLKVARKLEYSNEAVETDSIPGISAIFVNPITMDSTFQEGLIAQTTTMTRRKETFNNLHLINIPLNLGISLNYEQWVFGVQGGASLNVFLNQKGEIHASESTFYDLGEDRNNWFKNNIGVSYQGAAFVGYTFSDHFQIIGGPSFRSPMVISEDSNPVRQSFVNLGLQVSARYWW